ncbi:aldehyde dehydrogenase [Rhodococcus oxybenzonivorans]|nr:MULTISPECIES: aldehyde dehydrogenase [Rhodococcus]MDV7242659.1 aldehyde dehydrogenase [Rhodococcus oxybenzonivorans]MDV7276092.1 aldehyde dehydrogenase [Rhodococcus oxybenzonivorans]MDV7332147.1 aldehyde dehydrogenase [Rhodococcus oxybenzonivorans]MDV7344352.1 aldehyde dehydrogenase [Rhodococcus oxybenzonivorans]MDV8027123.1 aldehyde dehydrogenase [Rhodococcus sp. IEGM 27]
MMIEHHQHFIGGKLVESHSAGRIEVIDPATEQVIGMIADGDARDIAAAVGAAEAAAPAWAAMSAAERATVLRAIADAFEARMDEISALVTRQNGTPISIARAMQSQVPVVYRYFADLADVFEPEELVETASGDAIVRREPVGVVGAIIPWNGPQPLTAWKLGPALAAGCTVVIKPAQETSLDAFLFAEILTEANVPDGVVNIVTGGRETGAALVADQGVRKIAFTGSTRAGRAIAAECAAQLKRVTLELGGKSAGILLDDVNLDEFRPLVLSACSPNTGQTCRALTRVLVPSSRHDEIVEMLTETLSSIPQGDPSDPVNLFGPLVNAPQRERVESYIALGRAEGATVVLGGGRPEGLERGYYVEPTIFTDVTNDMRIAREEIFGPVLVVMSYETVDEAVAIANDSEYGLGGGVFSSDREKATEVARRIVSGSVGINTATLPIETPFGGVKNSGMGRELGPQALDAYLEYKTLFRAK